MLRYRLDDLGCYQFEKLVQSSLKAAVGLGVESWGNRADMGRDAYTPGPLHFPDPRIKTKGPFLFQAKLVEGANAAGSRPNRALLSSASKERARILQRLKHKAWKCPSHFTFITNSPIDAVVREKIRALFAEVLPSTEIYVWSGDDVCDILDKNPNVVRAFPQLLSIRDLDALIASALQKESRERSAAAIEVARELVPVFAPTQSYERAWAILHKHHFVVLEGPPEVGKSAIAWMIGLTQAGSGWEAIVCRTPDTFFEKREANATQVFIADDAFGRTEYDPARTSKWEADLDLILHRLDKHHWLIWTSRKHILERACQRMDAQGKARSFPDPGSVLVDVKILSVEEKALLLFRHAKQANLEAEAKKLVRTYASDIISDAEFTPERIRRLVQESLPALLKSVRSQPVKSDQVRLALKEMLRNPTKQMRVAFQKLPAAYKWFLVALLEISEIETFSGAHSSNIKRLRKLYESYCPDVDREAFETVTDHLTEAFVKTRKSLHGTSVVDWIHPSYRDLVIDELIEDANLRNTFIRGASLEGIKLAVSGTGGRSGERRLPFIRSAESWDILKRRCLSLIGTQDEEQDLLETLADAASQDASPDNRRRWETLLWLVCNEVRDKWHQRPERMTAEELESFAKARGQARPTPQLPDLECSWEELEERFRDGIQNRNPNIEFDFRPFDELSEFAQAVRECAPEYLEAKQFPDKYKAEIAVICEEAESEANARVYSSDSEILRGVAERMETIASAVERIADISPSYSSVASIASRLRSQSSQLEDEARQNDPPEPDYDGEYSLSSGSDVFDVQMLFAEL
jgi:hypothetical protein